MKKVIVVMLMVLFAFASVAMSKALHPPVLISSFTFSEDQNGNKIAVANGEPLLMNEFENPILCSSIDNPVHKNGSISECFSPLVFMGKGGIVKLWERSWEEESLSNHEIRAKPSKYEIQYYLMETPKYIYYCVYPPDSEASLCRLFPDDPDIKFGDQFASCFSGAKSLARDKDGIPYDCDASDPLVYREVKFIMQSVLEEGIFLRAIVSNSFPLNKNGRINVMGVVTGKTVFMLVKLKETPKAKSKSPKTKKK